MLEGLIITFVVFIVLGVVSIIGAWHTAKFNSANSLIGIYILFLTLAQFFAAKSQSVFDFGLFSLVAPAGVIVFPFTLQVTDMVNEKFGRKTVYQMIWIALVSQVIMVVLLLTSQILPLAESWGNDPDPLMAFAVVPAITIASWISFLISERFDAWIYDQFRKWIRLKNQNSEENWYKYLWIRNVFSDILSLSLDSIIFVPLAFGLLPMVLNGILQSLSLVTGPILPFNVIITLIFGQLITKWILGVIDTPFMYLTRWIYNKYE
ncbi:queuosine precursor transporter [Candidatus Hodarchaeum mangrovi]